MLGAWGQGQEAVSEHGLWAERRVLWATEPSLALLSESPTGTEMLTAVWRTGDRQQGLEGVAVLQGER